MLALLLAASLLPAGPACHVNGGWSASANLDGDVAKEQVRAYDYHDCGHTHFAAKVEVRDRCRGASRILELAYEQGALRRFRVTNVDGWTGRREVFFFIGDKAKIIRLVDRRGACPQPVDLFTVTGASSVVLGDLAPRRRGLELRVVVNGETTLFRYDRTQRRYVQYAG